MAITWAPTLVDVAGCIPTRTRSASNPADDRYLNTFNDDTDPTAELAQRKIENAVADVTGAVSSITVKLEPLAKNAAMWRAAADIELAYPDRNADANYYTQLDARARYEWEQFLEAAEDAGSGPDSSVPLWSMPGPSPWGDINL